MCVYAYICVYIYTDNIYTYIFFICVCVFGTSVTDEMYAHAQTIWSGSGPVSPPDPDPDPVLLVGLVPDRPLMWSKYQVSVSGSGDRADAQGGGALETGKSGLTEGVTCFQRSDVCT